MAASEELAARLARAEQEREAYSAALHAVVERHQCLISYAHLARLDGITLDPAELIDYLNDRTSSPCRALTTKYKIPQPRGE